MKILLIDDHESIRNSLTEFIVELGHTVLQAENGAEGWKLLNQKDPHLVLSDIRMPKMDGLTLLKKIKKDPNKKDTPIVLFTGHGDIKDAVQAMRDGAYDYLLKPVNVAELAIILKHVAELLDLREQNKQLTENFEEQVKNATEAVHLKLKDTQKALAEAMGLSHIGIFSESLEKVFKNAKILHENPDIPVLIEGETGTGKELIAKYIHYGDHQNIAPFIPLNCAAISSQLFESELFGYEAGAFTGGNPKGQKGKLELAENGTIFLDEITEMAFEHQAKLLRVLQEREFYRIGGLKKMTVQARFICATNMNVDERVKEGHFRQDLFFRLNVGYLRIPPLRERRDEIPALARLFLDELRQKKNTRFINIDAEAVRMLENYHWPGNVRELKNTIERIVLYWNEEVIQPKHLNALLSFGGRQENKLQDLSFDTIRLPEDGLDLNSFILSIVDRALNMHDGNQTRTARYLGISLRVLHTYLKKIKTRL